MPLRLDVNGSVRIVDADPQSRLLWVLRDELNLVGTKYGCGIGQCSACTVHLNGAPVPSCQLPAGRRGARPSAPSKAWRGSCACRH